MSIDESRPAGRTQDDEGPAPDFAGCCPLCGAGNRCGAEAGTSVSACWCMSVRIGPDTLASIPETLRGKACLCPACARGTAPL